MQKIENHRVQHAAVHITGIACTLWLCGCVETVHVPAPATSSAPPTASPSAAGHSAPVQSPTPTPPADSAVGGDSSAAPRSKPAQSTAAPAADAVPVPVPPAPTAPAVHPKPTAAAAASTAAKPAVKAKPPTADAAPRSKPELEAPATPAAAPPPASLPPASPSPAPAPAQATSAPPLDLTSLKQRLRETSAIGVFTKLALKNQVDDLLDKFRGFYRGQVKITLPELRQSYELLVQKVLALLQDSDPPLAKEITASREAIWGLLADPQKFATL